MPVSSRRFSLVLPVLLALAGCGQHEADSIKDLNTRAVTLPDGTKIRAELVTTQSDLMRGLKYRDSLDQDAGMLFAYGKPGFYRYWMHEVKFPIDMMWLDRDHRIVQLIHKVPPCAGPAETCPVYGGDFEALFVLELNAGAAMKYNLKPGMVIQF
ncbi:MAG TPA: DUF192 domain-containing protein [Bryobacteraceae bacterium]|nr:DUF192 domain-containing protein [Bryobacteraceae bacterium]